MMAVVVDLPAWREQLSKMFRPDDRNTSPCQASGVNSSLSTAKATGSSAHRRSTAISSAADIFHRRKGLRDCQPRGRVGSQRFQDDRLKALPLGGNEDIDRGRVLELTGQLG